MKLFSYKKNAKGVQINDKTDLISEVMTEFLVKKKQQCLGSILIHVKEPRILKGYKTELRFDEKWPDLKKNHAKFGPENQEIREGWSK